MFVYCIYISKGFFKDNCKMPNSDNQNFLTTATRNLTDEDINTDFQTEFYSKKIKFVDPLNLDIFSQSNDRGSISCSYFFQKLDYKIHKKLTYW